MKTILLVGTLAVLTVIYPRWIEVVFGVDPDADSGAAEALIVLACVGVAFARGLWLVTRTRLNRRTR